MNIIESDMVVFFDVDNTLIKWEQGRSQPHDCIYLNKGGVQCAVWVHRKHLEKLKQHRARGHKIVVWSAGGYAWAKSVVEAMEIETLVDMVVAKPAFYYDDLQPEEFLPVAHRIFYKDEQ